MISLTKDSWVVLGVLAVIIAAVVVLVYMPQGRKLEELRTSITSRKDALESQARKVAVLPKMLRQVEQLKNRYRNFDQRLPKRTDLEGFLREISSQLAKESDLISDSYTPGDPEQEELVHKLPIKMRLRGSYLSLASFLKRVGNMQRLTRVERLILKQDPEGTELDIDMQLNIYFYES